ncbi:MAG TPA: alpha-2-macroglobulin family protein, partial [Gemmata sp.]|nr:alpha-2-macroglobulin family protein [Gemmata sp.]
TIFFIANRSAYRPGHTLMFAAFLRALLPNGEFEPVVNREVTIDLTSLTKQTRATRLKLKSDDFGRITGEYTFSEADALDHYILSAEGFSGDAKVLFGEYRKSKVGLKLTGEVKDGKLQVAFDARDYLNRPVKGTAVSYVATVSKTAEPGKLTLNPAAFAKPESGPPTADEFDALSEDERLLMLANGVSATTFAGFGSQVVGTREGTVSPSNDGGAKLELDLQPEWLKGNYAIAFSGVFTDETGRENRAAATFKLDPTPTNGVRISTPRQLFVTGEKIPVTLTPYGLDGADKSTTTLVLVRLHEQAALQLNRHLPGRDIDDEDLPASTRLPVLKATKNKKPASEGWKCFPIIDTVKREIHSLVPVANNAAEITLKQPGAYKFLALTKLADGTTIQSETGVVVMAPSRSPSLVLRLDRREIESGTRLTGVVHAGFAGAKLLLTLRDSTGIKLTRALTTAANGIAKIDEALPPNLRYGCAVCVQYPETATTIHVDQRELFVIPSDRTIKVTTSVPPEFGPGAEVPLTVQVNRQEETDLIVSVYDESLLGVSGDLSKDIREYYLADTRGQPRAARELATTRLGSIAVADLVKKAAVLLEDKAVLSREINLEEQLKNLHSGFEKGTVTVANVVTLMRLTGLEVYLADPTFTSDGIGSRTWRLPRNATLADLLRRAGTETDELELKSTISVSATVIGNVVLLGFARRASDHRHAYDPWTYYLNNPYGYGIGGYGMFAMGGQLGFQGQVYNFGSAFSGMGGRNQGFGGGFGGISGGQLGFGGGFAGMAGMGGNTIYTGIQGGFSHPGGQMGMSFGSNRDFVNSGIPGFPAAGPLPGLGLGQELVRRDFADSAFWSAKLRTDKTGKATTTFKVPDSLTTWRVQVTAISSKMHVGSGTAKFKTTRSIMIWPMLPRTFTEGDVVRVFGTVHN